MEYFRGISNPIGIKISDKSDGDGVVSLVKTLNPENVPGRITLITRMVGWRRWWCKLLDPGLKASKHHPGFSNFDT